MRLRGRGERADSGSDRRTEGQHQSFAKSSSEP